MTEKIGLVLGGGGIRGLAHIGVIEVLAREAIPVDLIVGTSMGAVIGVTYALGHTTDDLKALISTIDGNRLFALNLFSARARQRAFEEILAQLLDGKTFEDLKFPAAVTAVDMHRGVEVVINKGPLIPAIVASSAVPGIFPPVEHMGMLLADGGVLDSVSVKPALDMGATKTIVVDVYPPLEDSGAWGDPLQEAFGIHIPLLSNDKSPGTLGLLWRAYRVMAAHIHEERLRMHPPDVLLRPDVTDFGAFNFSNIEGPVAAGVAEAELYLDAIIALRDSVTQ